METVSHELVYIYKAGKRTWVFFFLFLFLKHIPHTEIKIVSALNLKNDIICAVAHFSFLCITFDNYDVNLFLTYRFALILSEVQLSIHWHLNFVLLTLHLFFSSSSKEVGRKDTTWKNLSRHLEILLPNNSSSTGFLKQSWSKFVPITPFSSYVGLLIGNHVPDEHYPPMRSLSYHLNSHAP